MFSIIYNWLFPRKNESNNGLDDELDEKIHNQRIQLLPFAWKYNKKNKSIKKTNLESISVSKKNKQKLSKIHSDSDNLILYANEYANQSKILSNKIKE